MLSYFGKHRYGYIHLVMTIMDIIMMRNRSVSHTCYSDSASMICESQTIVVDYVLMSISHEKVTDLNEGDGRGEE